MKPLISVCILNYRTPLNAVSCAKNLLNQTIADEIEIFVIDNNSDNDTIGILRNRLADQDKVKIIEVPKNLGFATGNNYGSKYAEGEYLLFLNPDTEPENDALEKLIDVLKSDPSIGIIAPKLVFTDGTVRDSYRTYPTVVDLVIKRSFLKHIFKERMKRYLQYDSSPDKTRDIDWVVGAFMLMKRELFEELGGFDSRYFLFLEDTDLCRKCWNAGKRVLYYPQVEALDGKQRLSGSKFRHMFTKKTGRIHMASAVKYFMKWGLS
ncbi:MAG: glycosyltransferase family 2 protein [Candidatus Peribacteraceae bacterium]|nr:glycosyltransferase family 2 protein [Candidatus Peribacteraceae bacterium]|tara:strand:+ start:6393 stop:7187 length:795 start_codon:yes stop_codon:yes gene_type:complete